MSNIAKWNVRLRHEALSKVHTGKYLSRRKRARIGLQEALDRKAAATSTEGEAQG